MKAKLIKALVAAFGLNALLFVVFFFDVDRTFQFYVYEPFMKKHYDEMERRDMTQMPYSMDKPNYEYDV